MRGLLRAAIPLAAPVVVALSYGVWLSQRVDGGKRLVVLHLMAFAALGVTCLIVAWGLGRIRLLARGNRRLIARVAFLTVASFFLLAIYVGNVVSNVFWQDTLAFSQLRYFLLELHVLRDELPIARSWLYATLAVVLAVSFLYARWLSDRVFRTDGHLESVGSADQHSTRRPLRSWAVIILLLSVVTGLAAAFARPDILDPADTYEGASARFEARLLLRREPLIGLFVNHPGTHSFRQYWIGLRAAAEEDAIRTAYRASAGARRRNVVLIVSDSLRPDHMGVYGYGRPTTPFLSEIQDQGRLRRVDLALATCPSSPCGISSILASKSLASILPENFALHELLYDQGYGVHFLLAGDHHWGGLEAFYGASVTTLFDGTRSERFAAADDRVVLEGLEALPDYEGVPAFFYFHLMSPHVFAPRLPAHVSFEPMDSGAWLTPESQGGEGAFSREAAINFYDNGVVQADAMVREIVKQLDVKGYLRDALVIVTSDHGESLGEQRLRIPGKREASPRLFYGHFPELYQEYLSIPMLFWGGGEERDWALDFARQIDIAPTILDWLGLPKPRSWEGTSLLSDAAPHEALVIAESPALAYGLVSRRDGGLWKYLNYSSARWNPREELYELRSDPEESRNLVADVDRSLLRELRNRLESRIGVEPR